MLDRMTKIRRSALLIERYATLTENIIKMRVTRKGQLLSFKKFMKSIFKNRFPNYTIYVPDI